MVEGGKLFYNPKVFCQGNLIGFNSIIKRIIEEVNKGCLKGRVDKICELYAGVGMIGLNLIDSGKTQDYVGSDLNPENLECFMKARKSLTKEYKKCEYFQKDARESLKFGMGEGRDTLIVDPPRQGLEEYVVGEVNKPKNFGSLGSVKNLIYVSCGLDGLMRDLEDIKKGGGGWEVRMAEGFTLFPGSEHVETLVVLMRD